MNKSRIIVFKISKKNGLVMDDIYSSLRLLIENSLDAGATDISVEITVGGRRLIRVSDNGHGMSRENIALAAEQHATSKIASMV